MICSPPIRYTEHIDPYVALAQTQATESKISALNFNHKKFKRQFSKKEKAEIRIISLLSSRFRPLFTTIGF